tara:strand:- start:114 stop:485 length:372 start_codon:yes stop_codon:yes gene_type:complete
VSEIRLKDIRLYAYHGCLPQETVIGSDYLVQLCVEADLSKSAQSDRLEDTVDYVLLQNIIAQEMATPSNLLEHVALRINRRIIECCPVVEWSEVVVSKINPPIGGDVDRVSIVMRSHRDDFTI